MVNTLSYSFLFPIVIYHCKIYQCNSVPRKKKNKCQKEAGRGPFYKNSARKQHLYCAAVTAAAAAVVVVTAVVVAVADAAAAVATAAAASLL